jgi:hypothetical protein
MCLAHLCPETINTRINYTKREREKKWVNTSPSAVDEESNRLVAWSENEGSGFTHTYLPKHMLSS